MPCMTERGVADPLVSVRLSKSCPPSALKERAKAHLKLLLRQRRLSGAARSEHLLGYWYGSTKAEVVLLR